MIENENLIGVGIEFSVTRNYAGPLVALVLFVGTIGAAAIAIYLPQRARMRRAQNERSIKMCLNTLATLEADFRANDRDRNGVLDFWTGDVSGLQKYADPFFKRIAEADSKPLIPLVPKPVPIHGYYIVALELDESETPHEALRQDTDGKSGKVHHLCKFAFLAYPETPSDGRHLYIINENWTVFGTVADQPRPKNWPSDGQLAKWWSKLE